MAVVGSTAPPPKGRLLLGAGVFVLGWVVTLAIASVMRSSALPASLIPAVVFVGPKLGVLGAIAILGKPGFASLKRLIFGYLTPPAEVSPTRHRIGMVMFVAAILLGFFEPYSNVFFSGYDPRDIRYSLAIDLLLVVSIFVLGGDFWDKIRALFIRDAKAYFPKR
jgi:hypothetical protein